MSSHRVELPHIPALDGIRGLGVLGILLFHAGHLTGGWLGVDLFFVLSGFLITSLLLVEFEGSGRISLGRFWLRRARRLLPALLLALLGVAAYASFIAEPRELSRIRGDGLATLFYVANWHGIFAGHDYWELFRSPSPLDHAWSLAIEEQFYLVWPPVALLVLGGSRRPVRALFGVAMLGALASALWMAWLFDEAEGTARVYFGTDTRAAATLVGSALAARLRPAVRGWPARFSPVADVVAILALALALLAGSWLFLEGTDPRVYRGGLVALALAAAAVISGVVLAPEGWVARALRVAPLRYLGIVSYGVYLWHWPLYLVLTPERIGLSGGLLTAVRIAASLAVASVSYFALERPVRRGVLAPRQLVLAAGAAFGVALAALLGATRPSGAPPGGPTFTGVEQPASASIVLVGDSVAEALGPALRLQGARRGIGVLALGKRGCVLMENGGVRFGNGQVLVLKHCEEARAGWQHTIEESKPPLVLVVEGGIGVGHRRIGEHWLHPCQPGYDEAFAGDLSRAVRSFERQGASTVIAQLPPPRLVDAPPNFRALRGDGDEAALERVTLERLRCQNAVRQEVAADTGAILVDLAELACPEGGCPREVEGVRLRPDGIHFDGEGARVAADWLLDRLEERGLLEQAGADRAGALPDRP